MADDTKVTETKPTFKVWLKTLLYKIGNFFIRYPLASAATILLLIGAGFMLAFGQKIQIGGILGWLWNRKTHDPDAVVVTPPKDRVDPTTGKIIQPGESDKDGWVQTPVVVPIKPPSVFSDPTTIKITPPGQKDITIKLPTGVKNKDIKEVVLVAPKTFQVSNKDKGVDAAKILEGLK